ncbi:MAG TPA: SCO family protein [Methylomirabilota bacterium]
MDWNRRLTVVVLALLLWAGGTPPRAQEPQRAMPAPTERTGPGAPPAGALPALLQDIGLDQKLNEQVPLGLAFRDEQGRSVTLGELFRGKPVVLVLAYYECPMLCTQVLNGLTGAMRTLEFTAGREFDVITVSFDPGETPELARAKKQAYLGQYGRPEAEAGWRFLTGDELEIGALTRAVGFRYAYNAEVDQYAHVSGIMVLTPDGRLSRYLYGIEYGPRDLRLALVEASERRIGSPADQVLLFCFHYDPAAGKYSLAIMNVLRAFGLLTVVGIVGGIVFMRRRERRDPLPRGARA